MGSDRDILGVAFDVAVGGESSLRPAPESSPPSSA
jgi:hypothetical protein